MASLMTRYLYSLDIRPNAIDNFETDVYAPTLSISWIALDEDLETGYDLVYDLLYDLKLDDTELLSNAVSSIRTTLKDTINQAPFNVQAIRGLARYNDMYRYMNYISYLDYYAFLGDVETMLQESPDQVTGKLEDIRSQLHNANGACTIAIGSQESIALREDRADAFLSRLENEEKPAAVYDLPVPASSEGLIVDSSVQYNGYVADYESLGLSEFTGDMDGLTALVLDSYLYPMLRDAYGVYSVLHTAMTNYGMYVLTYRDPNLNETFDVIAQLGDLLENDEISQDVLDGYILSSYSTYALSPGVITSASRDLTNYLNGLPSDIRIRWMQELKSLTPEKLKSYAQVYRELAANGYKTSSGGAGVINANADQFEVILNPFNTADNSQVEFEDLPEDSAYYEAVRFVFENGMMDPESDTAFGVESQATAGDLAGGLFVMIGGYPHAPEDGAAALSQAGLFPADLSVDTPLTKETADGVINALIAAAGMQDAFTTEDDSASDDGTSAVTRGDLALALYALATIE